MLEEYAPWLHVQHFAPDDASNTSDAATASTATPTPTATATSAAAADISSDTLHVPEELLQHAAASIAEGIVFMLHIY